MESELAASLGERPGSVKLAKDASVILILKQTTNFVVNFVGNFVGFPNSWPDDSTKFPTKATWLAKTRVADDAWKAEKEKARR